MFDGKSIFKLSDDDEVAKTDKEKKSEQPDTTKQEQVKKMSGFSDIGEVKRAAPSSYETTSAAPPRSRRATAIETKKSKEEQEKLEKEQRKQAAINTIGKRYTRLLAETPYEMWARFAEDPALSLTKEESDELAGAYFELAQALQPDLTSPWVLAGGIVFLNVTIVGRRLKHLKKMEQTEAEEQAEIEAKEKLKRAEIGIPN